jgi:ubiquinone/menaquinone biosynthesis C-methylase UbiE
VSPLAIASLPAALVFDQMASEYDDVFTRSSIGRAQRDVVWHVLTQAFRRGDHVLELNCGTGEDALFLARHAIAVTACDASPKMIQMASERLRTEALNVQVQFNLLPTERLHELQPATTFDGAFSNFSGLNCVSDLKQAANDLASLLSTNAALIICLSTRFCVWEMIWFLLHGKFRKAFRRCSGHAIATVGEFTVDVYYPTVRKLRHLFAPSFVMRSCKGVGVVVPPSYVETWINSHPKLLRMFCAIDRIISSLPGFRVLGDHMILRFERVPV